MVKHALRRFSLTSLMLLLMAAGLFLTACRQTNESTAAVPATTEVQTEVVIRTAAPTAYPAPAMTEKTAASLASPYPAPVASPELPTAYPVPEQQVTLLPTAPQETPAEAAPTRPVKQELEASDPAAVQLASGKVQLVEFFAFW